MFTTLFAFFGAVVGGFVGIWTFMVVVSGFPQFRKWLAELGSKD